MSQNTFILILVVTVLCISAGVFTYCFVVRRKGLAPLRSKKSFWSFLSFVRRKDTPEVLEVSTPSSVADTAVSVAEAEVVETAVPVAEVQPEPSTPVAQAAAVHEIPISAEVRLRALEKDVAEQQRIQKESSAKREERRLLLEERKLQQKAEALKLKQDKLAAKQAQHDEKLARKAEQKAERAAAKAARAAERKLRWAPRKQKMAHAIWMTVKTVVTGILLIVAIPFVLLYVALKVVAAIFKALWEYAAVSNNNRAKLCIALTILLTIVFGWVYLGELFPSSDVPLAEKMIADFMKPTAELEPSTSLWLLIGLPICWLGWTIFTIFYSILALREEGTEFGATVFAKIAEAVKNLSSTGISGIASVFQKEHATASDTYVIETTSPPVYLPPSQTGGVAVQTAEKGGLMKFFSSFEKILPYVLLIEEIRETLKKKKA